MNSKEAYRPVKTVEGVVKQNDINLIKYILPGGDYQLEVLKTEGDYMSALDLGSKLPKGYAFVRLSTESEIAGKFGVNLKNFEPEGPGNPVFVPAAVPSGTPEVVLDAVEPAKTEATKPNPEVFRQRPQEKAYNPNQNSFKEKANVSDNFAQTDKGDSLGYFKALNLNANELAGLTNEEVTKKIKSGYRAAASIAHPDHGGNHEAMVKVNRAMEVVSNPSLRSAYIHQTGQFAPQARP